MNYPNLPNSALEITSQPEVKEITNDTMISKVLMDLIFLPLQALRKN